MTPYSERIHSGLPLDNVEIIDVHAHLGPYFNMHIPDCEAESMIMNMDRCGIDKTVFSTTFGINADFVAGNEKMLEEIKHHRGRLYGACLVNGHYPEMSMDELEHCFSADFDVTMIKIHPFSTQCRMDDRRMNKIYEFASQKKLLVLVHTWLDNDAYGNQDLFAQVAKDYPDIKWLMGHSGGPYGSNHAVELAQEIKNIYLDIALSTCPARQIEFLVKEVGSKHVLFGTDNPFIDPRPQIGRVGLARISHEDKLNIFSRNAMRLINFDRRTTDKTDHYDQKFDQEESNDT